MIFIKPGNRRQAAANFCWAICSINGSKPYVEPKNVEAAPEWMLTAEEHELFVHAVATMGTFILFEAAEFVFCRVRWESFPLNYAELKDEERIFIENFSIKAHKSWGVDSPVIELTTRYNDKLETAPLSLEVLEDELEKLFLAYYEVLGLQEENNEEEEE